MAALWLWPSPSLPEVPHARPRTLPLCVPCVTLSYFWQAQLLNSLKAEIILILFWTLNTLQITKFY